MNDKELRQLVIDELEYEPGIDAADIGVAAENSVITLSGHVTDYAQKTTAERAAWRVRGVKGIAQKIEVRLPSDKRQNDDEIAQRALSILAWNAVVPRDNIRVRVADGWVTLSGKVNWDYQRRTAESEVRKLGGIKGLVNEITLTEAAQVADAVRRRIQDALKRHAEIRAADVHVDIRRDGTVRLKGHVHSWGEKQAVRRAVWSASGVRQVEDHVTIE